MCDLCQAVSEGCHVAFVHRVCDLCRKCVRDRRIHPLHEDGEQCVIDVSDICAFYSAAGEPAFLPRDCCGEKKYRGMKWGLVAGD